VERDTARSRRRRTRATQAARCSFAPRYPASRPLRPPTAAPGRSQRAQRPLPLVGQGLTFPQAWALLSRPLQARYIRPRFAKCPALRSPGSLRAVHRFAPCGFTKQALCKVPSAWGHAPRVGVLPGPPSSCLRPPAACAFRALHCPGLKRALRAGVVERLRHSLRVGYCPPRPAVASGTHPAALDQGLGFATWPTTGPDVPVPVHQNHHCAPLPCLSVKARLRVWCRPALSPVAVAACARPSPATKCA
jgi:hypothetical protein